MSQEFQTRVSNIRIGYGSRNTRSERTYTLSSQEARQSQGALDSLTKKKTLNELLGKRVYRNGC